MNKNDEVSKVIVLSDSAREFHMEEYKTLRDELKTIMQKAQTTLLFSFGAIGAILAWIATNIIGTDASGFCANYPDYLVYISLFVPLGVMMFPVCIYTLAVVDINRIVCYTLQLEQMLAHNHRGWEHFVREDRKYGLMLGILFFIPVLVFLAIASLIFLNYFNSNLDYCVK